MRGGDGGSTTGNEGAGGMGLAQGAGGETYFENVGNGGNGGDGEEPGSMGLKGDSGERDRGHYGGGPGLYGTAFPDRTARFQSPWSSSCIWTRWRARPVSFSPE